MAGVRGRGAVHEPGREGLLGGNEQAEREQIAEELGAGRSPGEGASLRGDQVVGSKVETSLCLPRSFSLVPDQSHRLPPICPMPSGGNDEF